MVYSAAWFYDTFDQPIMNVQEIADLIEYDSDLYPTQETIVAFTLRCLGRKFSSLEAFELVCAVLSRDILNYDGNYNKPHDDVVIFMTGGWSVSESLISLFHKVGLMGAINHTSNNSSLHVFVRVR